MVLNASVSFCIRLVCIRAPLASLCSLARFYYVRSFGILVLVGKGTFAECGLLEHERLKIEVRVS
jgi:hypothetical protein